MTLLLVIDDMATLMLVKNQLKEIVDIDSIVECNTAEDALFLIMEKKPDLVISSDNLPKRSGFDLVNISNKNGLEIPFIILSNNASRAVEAIKNRIFDFLVFPFTVDKLVASVRKLLCEVEGKSSPMQMTPHNNSFLRLNSMSGFRLIEIEKLTHCQADGSYTKLFFSNGETDRCSTHLGRVEKALKEMNFVRINRATIINLARIKSIDKTKGTCSLDTDIENNEFRITDLILKRLIDSDLIRR